MNNFNNSNNISTVPRKYYNNLRFGELLNDNFDIQSNFWYLSWFLKFNKSIHFYASEVLILNRLSTFYACYVFLSNFCKYNCYWSYFFLNHFRTLKLIYSPIMTFFIWFYLLKKKIIRWNKNNYITWSIYNN